MAILPEISGPDDVKRLDAKQLDELAAELRQTIIDTVSRQGGHLASNLGDVELTIALHRAFNSPTDKLVFDVGHQIYAHKLLTGRQEQFKTLRSYHGMSGFPCREESEHDLFDTGHSSTSISMALGLARARDLNHEDYHVVAIVGDGALTGGMCYEAMNDAGNGHTRLIVVLNDNEMSISKNVGALSEYFKHLRASASWYGSKKRIRDKLTRVPLIGKPLARAIENAKNMVKSVTTGGEMFEALGFRYLGPFDGHNIEEMTHVFEGSEAGSGYAAAHPRDYEKGIRIRSGGAPAGEISRRCAVPRGKRHEAEPEQQGERRAGRGQRADEHGRGGCTRGCGDGGHGGRHGADGVRVVLSEPVF